MSFFVKRAITEQDYHQAQNLVLAYVKWLNIDLSYQQFEQELVDFKNQYGPPTGGMLLLMTHNKPVGCLAIRHLEHKIGELKRMFILENYRGKGQGRILLLRAIELARQLSYHKIRLDTLPTMRSAVHLYRSFGFCEIAPYRFNPHPDTIYMELNL